MTRRRMSLSGQKGFTIIELMIATAVLSTMLVLVTVVMVNIGNLYYKGVNQARVQDTARNITDQVSEYIKLSDRVPIGPVNGANGTQLYCVGGIRYAFVLGTQIGNLAPGTATRYYDVLWRDTDPTPGSCPTEIDPQHPVLGQLDLTRSNLKAVDPEGTELIANNSRLTEFSMANASPSAISVGVAYGDDVLLCNPSAVPNSCNNAAAAMPHQNDYTGPGVLCKGGRGDQFCSTANLNVTVVQRL